MIFFYFFNEVKKNSIIIIPLIVNALLNLHYNPSSVPERTYRNVLTCNVQDH